MDQQQKNYKTERARGLGRQNKRGDRKGNQMTALRFQTGGRHQTTPASLRGTNIGERMGSDWWWKMDGVWLIWENELSLIWENGWGLTDDEEWMGSDWRGRKDGVWLMWENGRGLTDVWLMWENGRGLTDVWLTWGNGRGLTDVWLMWEKGRGLLMYDWCGRMDGVWLMWENGRGLTDVGEWTGSDWCGRMGGVKHMWETGWGSRGKANIGNWMDNVWQYRDAQFRC